MMNTLNEDTSRIDAATFDGAHAETAADIAGAVRSYGAAFIRNAISNDILSHYRTLLGVDAALEADRANPDAMEPILHRSSRNLLTHHSYSDIVEPLGHWFAQSPLADVARGILGRDEIWLEVESSYFREALPPKYADIGAGYHSVHNDGWFAQAGGMANFWIALTPCGADAPALEVIHDTNPGNWVPECLVDLVDPAKERDQAFDEIVAQFGADKCWHPVFEPGDLIVFHHFTHHRTYFTPEMASRRLSIEFRVLGKRQDGKPGLIMRPGGDVEVVGLELAG